MDLSERERFLRYCARTALSRILAEPCPRANTGHSKSISKMLRSCAKAEGFRDSAERPVDGPDLRAVCGNAGGNELSIDEADAFGKQAASFEHVSHVRRAYGW